MVVVVVVVGQWCTMYEVHRHVRMIDPIHLHHKRYVWDHRNIHMAHYYCYYYFYIDCFRYYWN